MSSTPHDPGPAPVLEDALTQLVWADTTTCEDLAAALARLGVDVPEGMHVEVRVQRRDTVYFVIPPAADDGGDPDVRAALVADPKAALAACFGAIADGERYPRRGALGLRRRGVRTRGTGSA